MSVPATTNDCQWCAGGCAQADLGPLLTPDLAWLWARVADLADRRGDPQMSTGTLTVTAPTPVTHRQAAVGLLGGRELAAGQQRRVDLAAMTDRLAARGPGLTPGMVAAHAQRRRLATHAQQKTARAALTETLRARLSSGLPARFGDPGPLWQRLHTTGWVGRLRATPDPRSTLRRVLALAAALPPPGERVDRRRLAEWVLDDPYGLDDGAPVASLALGLLTAAQLVPAGARPREAWQAVGVDYDELTGGLLVLGIAPLGWRLPIGTVAAAPPRELDACGWPAPGVSGDRVWVTENHSVMTAAAELAPIAAAPVRLVCTSGTPSALEVAALARLAAAGWSLAVRADFDAAGLAHTRALLAGIPDATPWRMGAADYEACVDRSPAAPPLEITRLGSTGWDPCLVRAMARRGVIGSEESLLPELLADLTGS